MKNIKNKGLKESAVLAQCLQYLRLRGIFCWRQNTGAFKTENGGFFRSSMPGIPDIIGILPDGRFLGVECKRQYGGKLSEAQKIFCKHITDNNGVYIIATSYQDIAAILDKKN